MPHIFSRIIAFIFLTFFFGTIVKAQDYTLPSNFYEANCVFQSEKFDMSIAEKYRSAETDVSTYFPAVVGDLDGDGFGEIVIPGGTHNASQYIYIFNHKAELIRKITLPNGATMNLNDDSVVLADLDNDGKSEIIVTASNGRKLFVFDYKGDLITSVSYPTVFPKTPGVADFNNDGIPEIYIGTSIYSFQNRELILIADGGNYQAATVAQHVMKGENTHIPQLISVEGVYKVAIKSLTDPSLNSVTKVVSCNAISTIATPRERTFALADIDLDGVIDVVTVVPIRSPQRKLELKVWDSQTGKVKYALDIEMNQTASTNIRASWPFIGDTDANGYPDIIFMGGLASPGHTAVYRLEYDKDSHSLKERARNSTYNDYSSMSTSMSMFDFNNDGKQEIVYRDEDALYIINGETLEYENKVDNCFSGTGWEYPVVASLTPSGESSIIMCSGSTTRATRGTLRIYGADVNKGNKPWMPARKVWNQYSFYQNMIQDDLTIIAKPAPLNVTLTSKDGSKRIQPFNGHMFQLGIIRPSSLESVYPLADAAVDIATATYGFNRVGNQLGINFDVSNIGDAPMDPDIAIEVFKVVNGESVAIYTDYLTETFDPGDQHSINISIDNFIEHYPFDYLEVHVAKGKYDCNPENNKFTILPEEISGVLFVKKGNTGKGLTWKDAMGELSEALEKAEIFNTRYPYSLTQIWVAEGTYKGNFVMQEGVNIYGGFEGNELNIEESRPLTHPTILDAAGSGRPLTQAADFAQPTEWRGLTLQNGNGNIDGGGAYLGRGSILSYCIVRNNMGDQGGAIYADGSSIVNCIIEQNTATHSGGGIFATNGSVLINNTIVKNKIMGGDGDGGGIFADISMVVNNIVYKNTANDQIDNIFALASTVSHNLANNDNSVEPLFVNFESGDYNLLPISSALNVGNNEAIADRKLDFAGNDRIYEDKTVDLGAFEYQGTKLALSKKGYFYVNNAKMGDGADWENATTELSDALLAAKLVNNSQPNTVREIWVAAGTYKGVYEMVEGVDVHGGFAGNETDFNRIDTVTNKTYIDAQGLGRALTQPHNFETPTEWAGFIFQNGNETAIDMDVYGGGAYLKKNGAIRYSTIRNNRAIAISINNEVNAYGGGVYMEEGANLTNSIIDNNFAAVEVNSEHRQIKHGVAHGGGINNVKNRLAYLIVRNNKTISQGNTDGGAIYSTGNIINSIVNNNIGKSAIFISENQTVVNSTIVDNMVEYTVAGNGEAKVQNNIISNNVANAGNFNQVEYENLNNLIDTNPEFETGSYKLGMSSPARAIGNANYFPTDLNVDMGGDSRYIILKDNVKVIDAGAYQSNIKVVSATATKTEVPFGTKFEDVGLSDQIAGLLEAGYAFDCNVAWGKGVYNELEAGDYILYGDLSNLPDGVINPDEVQGTIVVTVKKNHISELQELAMNGQDWLSNLELEYAIDCDNERNSLPVTMTLPYFATVQFVPEIEFEQDGNEIGAVLNIPRPGSYSLKAIVTSQDGENTTTYPLTVVKYFPFWSIIEQRWNNTFVINNNKETNGGYEFVSYKWYKNNTEISSMQYYSAGDKRTDLLDEGSLYYAEMIDKNGVKYTTCKATPVLMNSGIKVYPNPVKMGETITIEIPNGHTKGATVSIYSLSGLSVKQANLYNDQRTIEAPSLPGMYILKVSINGGVSESTRMIVY